MDHKAYNEIKGMVKEAMYSGLEKNAGYGSELKSAIKSAINSTKNYLKAEDVPGKTMLGNTQRAAAGTPLLEPGKEKIKASIKRSLMAGAGLTGVGVLGVNGVSGAMSPRN